MLRQTLSELHGIILVFQQGGKKMVTRLWTEQRLLSLWLTPLTCSTIYNGIYYLSIYTTVTT